MKVLIPPENGNFGMAVIDANEGTLPYECFVPVSMCCTARVDEEHGEGYQCSGCGARFVYLRRDDNDTRVGTLHTTSWQYFGKVEHWIASWIGVPAKKIRVEHLTGMP